MTGNPQEPTNDTWLVVGIGSPHGSDRAGWDLADLLEQQLPAPWAIRRARVPTDLFDWIEGCSRLHLLDACPMIQQLGQVHRLEWPDRRILESRTATSHDYDLPQVLQLAQRLGQLPPQVIVWAIEVAATRYFESPTILENAARFIGDALLQEQTC